MSCKEGLDVLLDPDNPESPYSLQKIIYNVIEPDKPFTILVENQGVGFAHDAKDTMYITPEECKTQALYYKSIHDLNRTPWYLVKYLAKWYDLAPEVYNTPQEYDDYIKSLSEQGEDVTITSENGTIIDVKGSHKLIEWFNNKLVYLEHNKELCQCIGLIQLIMGTLSAAKKANTGVRFFVQEPETHLHPKRQSGFMTILNHIRESYK